MNLTDPTTHGGGTIDEFYTELSLSTHLPSSECGLTMLDLFTQLRSLPDKRTIYGDTSHYRLHLMSEDNYQSTIYVIVTAVRDHNYFIEYLMPDNIAPWPRAYVGGRAHSLDEAVKMILIGMENSGGWKDK